MRSIKYNFNKNKSNNPQLGSYILLAMGVKNLGFSRKQINENFKALVSKEEYSPSDKFKLITNLHSLSKRLEDSQKQTKNDLGASENEDCDNSIITANK